MTSLNISQKTAIQNSSSNGVIAQFGSIRANLLSGKWLSTTNTLLTNCLDIIKDDLFLPKDMSEYISVSSLLHCIDGWGFLGRAINCLSEGDHDVTRHLAYYAELRAAISILASQGIGIFNNKHYYVDSSGMSNQIPGGYGTHMMTWLAFEEWAGLSTVPDLITRIIRPNNFTLSDWLDNYPNYSGIKPIATNWLKTWGIDLSQLPQDRNARNEASYRPTKLQNIRNIDPINATNFLCSLWELLEPTASSRFALLDKHLLRKSLISLYESTESSIRTDTNGVINDLGYIKIMDEFLSDVSSVGIISTIEIDQWKTFLLNKNDPLILMEASGKLDVYNRRHHFQVISRALLLLRIASGTSAELLYKNGYNKNDVEFWWKSYGLDHSLWNNGKEPSDFCDLWNDIPDSIQKIRLWNNTSTNNTYFDLRNNDNAGFLSVLGTFERIALWGTNL